MSKTIYVEHPLTKDQKKAILQKNKDSVIVDAKFAGKDDKVYGSDGKAVTAKKAKETKAE